MAPRAKHSPSRSPARRARLCHSVERIDGLDVVVAVHDDGRRSGSGVQPVAVHGRCRRRSRRASRARGRRRGSSRRRIGRAPHVLGAVGMGGDGRDPQPVEKRAPGSARAPLRRSPPGPGQPLLNRTARAPAVTLDSTWLTPGAAPRRCCGRVGGVVAGGLRRFRSRLAPAAAPTPLQVSASTGSAAARAAPATALDGPVVVECRRRAPQATSAPPAQGPLATVHPGSGPSPWPSTAIRRDGQKIGSLLVQPGRARGLGGRHPPVCGGAMPKVPPGSASTSRRVRTPGGGRTAPIDCPGQTPASPSTSQVDHRRRRRRAADALMAAAHRPWGPGCLAIDSRAELPFVSTAGQFDGTWTSARPLGNASSPTGLLLRDPAGGGVRRAVSHPGAQGPWS